MLVRGGSGTFTLTFGANTTAAISYNAPASIVDAELEKLASVGVNNVTVTATTSAAGTAYLVTFVGGKAVTDVASLVANGAAVQARNEVQTITVSGASGGTYTVWYDANGDGVRDAGEVTVPIAFDEAAVLLEAALTALTGLGANSVAVLQNSSTYLVGFVGGTVGLTDVRTLVVDGALLIARDEIQRVQILNTTGGTFTLAFDANANGKIDPGERTGDIAYESPATGVLSVQSALAALTSIGAGNVTVTKTGAFYQITFTGAQGHKDVATLIADAARLVNTDPIGTIQVQLLATATSAFTTQDQLLAALQAKIDDALKLAGLTPGFLTTGLLTAGSSSTVSLVPFGAPQFSAQGPHIHGAQVEGSTLPDKPVSGGVQTIITHPTNANVIWVGTVNGGVWKSENADVVPPALGGVEWRPLLDVGPAMSIASMDLDPTFPVNSLGTNAVLVAAIGAESNFQDGSRRRGIYRTTDGGATWASLGEDLVGLDLVGVVARGNVIVVAAVDPSGSRGGIWRSTDTGNTFIRISGDTRVYGLDLGDAFDLQGDPLVVSRLYATISGVGVFRSDDLGATWAAVDQATLTPLLAGTNTNLKLAVHHSNTGDAVYVGIVMNLSPLCGPNSNCDRLTALRRFDNTVGGATWTLVDDPGTCETTAVSLDPRCAQGVFNGIHDGGQGTTNFSIVASPTLKNVVYVGGDTQPVLHGVVGNDEYTGRLFRCDASLAQYAQCTWITHSHTAGVSAPHADSRDLVFDSDLDLIEGDDGGIFKRTSPGSPTGDWYSLNGHDESIVPTESHSCDYDNRSDIIICGNQDTGTIEQTATDSHTWRSASLGDGGIVAVDDISGDLGGGSLRYSSYFSLGDFQRRLCTTANACGAADANGNGTAQAAEMCTSAAAASCYPTLLLGGVALADTQFYTPVALNAANAMRLVIGGAAGIYESGDRGQTLTQVALGAGGAVTGVTRAVAYGHAGNADVLYFGDDAGVLFLRTTGAGTANPLAQYAALTTRAPVDLAVDPDNWKTVYVTDGRKVFRAADATNAVVPFLDITGNLAGERILSLTIIKGDGFLTILAGTETGVFATDTQSLGTWHAFGTTLPSTFAFDVIYDSTADTIVVGTLGRGIWKLTAASSYFAYQYEPVTDRIFGAAPSDLAFQVRLPLVAPGVAGLKVGTTTSGGVGVNEVQTIELALTGGSFTLWFDANGDSTVDPGETTGKIAGGAGATVVQTALQKLAGIGAANVTVTKAGNVYTLTFVEGKKETNVAQVRGDVFIDVAIARTGSPELLARALTSNVTAALASAGLTFVRLSARLDATGHLVFTPSGAPLELTYVSPLQADGGSRVSIESPSVPYTYDADRAALRIDRRTEVNVVYENSSFQELGLTTAPTRFDFTVDGGDSVRRATDPIEFTLIVNSRELRITLPTHSDFKRLNDLDAALQAVIDTELVAFGFAAGDVKVCRPNPDPGVDAELPRGLPGPRQPGVAPGQGRGRQRVRDRRAANGCRRAERRHHRARLRAGPERDEALTRREVLHRERRALRALRGCDAERRRNGALRLPRSYRERGWNPPRLRQPDRRRRPPRQPEARRGPQEPAGDGQPDQRPDTHPGDGEHLRGAEGRRPDRHGIHAPLRRSADRRDRRGRDRRCRQEGARAARRDRRREDRQCRAGRQRERVGVHRQVRYDAGRLRRRLRARRSDGCGEQAPAQDPRQCDRRRQAPVHAGRRRSGQRRRPVDRVHLRHAHRRPRLRRQDRARRHPRGPGKRPQRQARGVCRQRRLVPAPAVQALLGDCHERLLQGRLQRPGLRRAHAALPESRLRDDHQGAPDGHRLHPHHRRARGQRHCEGLRHEAAARRSIDLRTR